MLLFDALFDYTQENLSQLHKKYSWKINYNDIPVPITPNLNDTLYDQNKKLRLCLSRYFASCDDNEKIKVITWYIKNWGGIRRTKENTIKEYTLSNEDDLIAKQSKGISSWSKALSIRNPLKFAIYDARVASALNSIQIIYNVDEKIYFPHLSSRNTKIIESNKIRNEIKKYWKNGEEIDFYRYYLKILEELVKKIGNGIDAHDIEMLLFADAEELAKVDLTKKKNCRVIINNIF